MKHRISIVLISLSMLLALVSVAAAPMASGNATLIGAGYVEGKGVVFTFHIDGKFSNSDLKGSVTFEGGRNFGLDCVKVDSETVKCTAPKAVAGHDVVVTWGGSTFWAHVAGIPDPELSSQYCYGVWDYWTTEQRTTGWVNFGPHCQDAPAGEGDEFWYTVPEGTYLGQDGSFEAPTWFVNDPDACEVPNHGPAYYWAPWCF